ncbi:glycosyltransferase family 1 protein [Cryobacterium sp. TMS1-13-1]|uniref:glycosyltransferase family 4 protein n=1 Tax=Cryobacterium sp. TMS1-13-1 TaxID=1259220 RepID=UPI00106C5AF7|nr:glycosyltransferase family 1 protein [Cryobacterium sp. TMS1-13-1]TFD19495.1 glycosyltransferase family 1 protein [Cryobacterium sp. TMS1-13-1]
MTDPLILVDLLFFTGKKGGMESYVREIYSRMPRESAGVRFIALASSELAAGDTSWFPGDVIDSGISGENRVAWARGELLSVAGFAHRRRASLIHCPANLGPFFTRIPVVLTIHDLLPFRHPEYVPGAYSLILRTLIRLGARAARRVLTISDATRTDIRRYLRIKRTAVDVIPLAGETRSTIATPTTIRRTDQLLAVGNRMPHKNFSTLLTALALLPEHTRPHLVITGSHGDDPLTPLVAELGLKNWVSLQGWLAPEQLDSMYAESTLFVFPTFFEGFGLPVLEAMAHGCPVLCSNIPVLHEVAGDAAIYVDSHDAARLADSISALLSAPEELASLTSAGLARAAEFTWDQTAQRTLTSFQRVLADR